VTAAQVKRLFALIDTDGSGGIDIDELVRFVWVREPTPPPRPLN
jgi:Ca2+-binding EF-hand superfamily protein